MTAGITDALAELPLPSLRGRRVVVTGASSGIGLATAMALAGTGARLVLGVRDLARGEAALLRIRSRWPQAALELAQVDLASLSSVAQCAARIGTEPVDILINNAGTNQSVPALTADGYDYRIGVNYLAAFALTARLWPALEAAGAARVVMLGSLMARVGRIGPDFARKVASSSYADSKLAALIFAGELDRRAVRAGTSVRAVAAHPGWADTAIFQAAGYPTLINKVAGRLRLAHSAADGAQSVLMAATAHSPAPYIGPSLRWGLVGPAGPARRPGRAEDAQTGTRLWDLSQELTATLLLP